MAHAGRPDEALQSADRALQLLALTVAAGDEACRPLLAKAHHRKAQALLGAGAVVAAVRVYRQGLDAVARAGTCQQGIEELLAALRLTAEQLPPSWLAKVGRGQEGAGVCMWPGGCGDPLRAE